MRVRASSIFAGFQYGALATAIWRRLVGRGEIVGPERRAAKGVIAFRDVRVPRREAPEEFHDVRRDAFVADHRQQRQEARRRAHVDGVEQEPELGFGLVEPVQLERRDARVAMRVLAGRVDLQPAAGGQRGLLQLGVIERRARGLLGDRFVVRLLGRLAIHPGAGRIVAPVERGLGGGQAGLGQHRVARGAGPAGAVATQAPSKPRKIAPRALRMARIMRIGMASPL